MEKRVQQNKILEWRESIKNTENRGYLEVLIASLFHSDMKIQQIIFSAIALLIFSCKNDRVETFSVSVQPTEVLELQPVLEMSYNSFANPLQITIAEDFLYLGDSKKEKFAHKIQLSNLKHVSSFGTKGKGPGEIISIFADIKVHDEKLWFFDRKLSKYIGYDIEDSGNTNTDGRKPNYEEIKIDPRLSFLRVIWLNDTTILGYGFFTGNDRRFDLIDRSSRKIDSLGSIPRFEVKNLPQNLTKQIADGSFSISPDNDKIAFGCAYSDLLQIINIGTNSELKIKTQDDFDPMFTVVDRNGFQTMGQSGDSRLGYSDITTSKNRIYGLYSGLSRDDEWKFGVTMVHVFDWQGNFLYKIKLSKKTNRIAVDKDDEFLYTIQNTETPSIAKYSLRSLE